MKTKKKRAPAAAPRPAAPPSGLFPIVGIGASAGGLEAVSALLGSLPEKTGMAYVLVQHLDPNRESSLAVILQKKTAMPVRQATNGMAIEPDHVYIIPPNAHIAITRGVLRLLPRPKGLYPMAVDAFLISLSEYLGGKAIAVILSGIASDGSVGVKAIKAEGGVVFAQDEESAAQSGMPHSAAETGAVDFILSPEKIAAELARMAIHPVLKGEAALEADDAATLARIFTLLRRATGVDFSLYKPSTIRRRLLRRLMLQKLARLDDYAGFLEKNPAEVLALHDDLLIHVTYFFREPKTMEVLRSKIFPRIVRDLPSGAPIRAWIPGCSTGEEAYSLAIALLEFMGEKDAVHPIQIFATDISAPALEKARAGVYSETAASGVPPPLLRRYFTKGAHGYEIAKRVRDLCVFARQDLTKDPPFGKMDIISCCNVLIYLSPQAQKHVLPMFHFALRPSGVLMLGCSETVGEHAGLFIPADKKNRLYYKNMRTSGAQLLRSAPEPTAPSLPLPTHALGKVGKQNPQPGWPESDVLKAAEQILLTRFAPAGVVANGNFQILHFMGRINRYLEPSSGKASLTLLKMMPAHSGGTVKELIAKAKKTGASVQGSGIELSNDGNSAETIGIEVVPFRLPLAGGQYFLILFTDEPRRGEGKKTAAAHGQGIPDLRDIAAVKRLKIELTSTRSYLQTIVEDHEAASEELKSANEEIVSSNEELQSTNEELEIAKEEIQAANEELNTLNDELQTRNNDLGRLNNDLNNLLASVHLPIIMVGLDLRIRRFTPTAEKIMNLIPGDVGRPITDIKPKMPLPNIEGIILDVIESGATKELEVRDAERAYTVRVRPYKLTNGKVEGAVLIFLDNEPGLHSSAAINAVSALEAVLDMAQEPVMLLDSQLRVQAASRAMCRTQGLTKDEIGQSLFVIKGGRWGPTTLREALEALSSRGQTFRKLAVRIGEADLLLAGRRVENSAGGPPLIILSVES